MVYAPAGSAERVITVEVPKAERTRFCLDDEDIDALARQALIIEEHYKKPMDIEWGKDGSTGKIYILQARPETVQSRAGRTIQRFSLKSSRSRVLASGSQHRTAHRLRSRACHSGCEGNGPRAGG